MVRAADTGGLTALARRVGGQEAWLMPELIVPLLTEGVAIIWRLTPALVRDIIEDGISHADVENYEIYEPPACPQPRCPREHVSERQVGRTTRCR